MSVRNPELQSVSPSPNVSGVVLRQPVLMAVVGPSLVDPRSFTSKTFAVYGPGDVVYDTGPGTLLNSGIHDDPYRLIDGVTIRDRLPGTYELFYSGSNGVSGLTASGTIGTSGVVVYMQFTPSEPMAPNTVYQAVLVGDDNAGTFLEGSGRYLGVTSWTSDASFAQSGTSSSGVLSVLTSYDRILPTTVYDSDNGYNDTYTVTITSGHPQGAPKFNWSQSSSVGTFIGDGDGVHDLGDNLTIQFSGNIITGQVYTLDTYIPKPLENTFVWTFNTSNLDASTPPSVPTPGDVIIDDSGAGFIISTATSEPLSVVEAYPDHLEYAVRQDLPAIVLEFNKTLASGVTTDVSGIQISISPLAGMPNITVNDSFYPSGIEVSGKYLKLWL
jgi:hypothetical protein